MQPKLKFMSNEIKSVGNLSFKNELRNDNVIVDSEVKLWSEVSSIPARKGYDKVVICEGEIVNIVGNSYGHLDNRNYFLKVEEQLIENDIEYITRSINNENRSFAVDYILNDDKFNVINKQGNDKIRPMLRFINAYDGSAKVSGKFGFFREICSNGLNVAVSKVNFAFKKKGNLDELVLPNIRNLIDVFMSNEFYEIETKFETLSNKPISNVAKFVETICDKSSIQKFAKSDKNPEPSERSQFVIDTINKEAKILDIAPNMWLGYNAINELIYTKIGGGFTKQDQTDKDIFKMVLEMAAN